MNALATEAAQVDYQSLRFDYRRHPDQDAAPPARHPVVVVGAGPVGLALAIDLALRQVPVVLLDNDNTLSTGSRAICFAKRTLEVFDRLGCGDRMVDKGVSWNIGKVYFHDEQVYRFDLLPEPGHERPAFINLQQYYVEGYLAERAAQLPLIDIRWNNKVTGIAQDAEGATLTVETPEGEYRLAADYVSACDGSRSNLRQLLADDGPLFGCGARSGSGYGGLPSSVFNVLQDWKRTEPKSGRHGDMALLWTNHRQVKRSN